MVAHFFLELTVLIGITFLFASFMKLLKQPLIIGYIFSGILLGPYFLDLVMSPQVLESFAEIGIAFLLFMVGLSLNPKVVEDVGKISLITGLGQVFFTSSIGFLVSRFILGFGVVESFYIAVALTFSSTIIIMKLISDKGDLDTLYGRISVGFLVVQDIVVVIMLLAVSSFDMELTAYDFFVNTILLLIAVIFGIFLLSKYVLPKLTSKIAKSQELLLLFSVTWCFVIAALFDLANFSVEAGALLAGMSLSVIPYHHEIASKMKPLRDFFLVLFFIMLGSSMEFANISNFILPVIIFSIFILIGNPLIVMILMGIFGYTKRTGFKCGLTVAQISEFSLVFITMGMRVGHVSNDVLSLVTFVGVLTIAGSTYMITYSDKIYAKISKYLSIFEKDGKKIDEHQYHEGDEHDIILFGYNRTGFDILKTLKNIKKQFLVIDYDPNVIKKLATEGIDCKYGDANDIELLNSINFEKSKMVISTIPDVNTNLLLINQAKKQNKDVIISVVSHHIDEAVELYEKGATYVIMPHFLGGEYFSTMIKEHGLDSSKFLKEKIMHLEHLKETN